MLVRVQVLKPSGRSWRFQVEETIVTLPSSKDNFVC